MNQTLYKTKCQCNSEILLTKKHKLRKRGEGKLLQYPNPDEIISKTFKIKYKKKLSSISKLVLNSFQNKHIYYALDDILYLFKSNLSEQRDLLGIISSPVLFLQNNFSINFFDLWIHEIYITEIPKVNKFLINDAPKIEQHYITIKFLYKKIVPIKKSDLLW